MSASGRTADALGRWRWALILAVALAARLLVHPQMAAAETTFAPLIDSEAYLLQAQRVAAGEPLVDGVTFQAPLYPWLLGQALRLLGVPVRPGADAAALLPPQALERSLAVGRGLNLVLGLIAVALVARLGAVLFGRGAGLAAGLLAAIYGPFLFYEGHLLKASLSLLFLPWATLAGISALRQGAPWRWIGCGLALGLGGLVRGNLHLISLLAALLLVLWGRRPDRRRAALTGAAALLLGVALVLGPIVARNSLAAGRLVLSTAAGGTAFFLCNHPDNDTGLIQHRPLNRQVPRHELEDWTAEAERREGRGLAPAEVGRYWFRQALAGIAERQWTWLAAEARKLGLLLSRYEAPDNTMPSFGEREVPTLALTPSRYDLILPLAVGGLTLAWLWRRRESPAAGRPLLAIALAAYAASLLAFIVTSRFRLPLVPLMMVYAGYLLARIRPLASGPVRPRERVLVGGAVLLGWGLSLVSEGPLGPLSEKERASHLVVCLKNRAQVAASLGDLEAARRDLRDALETGAAAGLAAPALPVEMARLDRLEAITAPAERQPDLLASARHWLQRALALDPADGAAWREQGLLLYQLGQDEPAITALREALVELPRDRETRQYLALSLLTTRRWDEAEREARWLIEHRPGDDDGWGLLALALSGLDRRDEAAAAVQRYDELVALREAGGWERRLPEQPSFAGLREPR